MSEVQPIVLKVDIERQIRQTAYAFTYAVALHGLVTRGFSVADCVSMADIAARGCVEGMKDANLP